VISLADARRVGGGDINDAYEVRLDDGRRAFVKTRSDPQPGEYETEAAGLRWLADAGAVAVPAVIEATESHLALEWIEAGGAYEAEELGRGLAELHRTGAPAFGALSPGAPGPLRIGPLPFDSAPSDEWPGVYAAMLRTLLPQAGLSTNGRSAVEAVCERMADLAGPAEPPARLHGDLWSGNVMAGADGRPWLRDPAAYGGHREVDLAMLQLFGAPGDRFFAAYEEVAPLAPGHLDRVALYQLLPLLVHAVLFGGGYAASVDRAARRYAG
jgi:fructosamine-3-kinase